MGNVPSTVPYGAQLNAVNIPLICSFTDQSSYNISISLTAPLSGFSGQQVNFTDFTSTIVLPFEFVADILEFGAAYYSANTTITLATSYASPWTLVVRQSTLRNVSITTDPLQLTIKIPEPGQTQNGVVAPLGPVTLGTGRTDLTLQNINFSVDIFASDGRQLNHAPQITDCQVRSPGYILSSIFIKPAPDTGSGPLFAPANIAPGEFPPAALGEKSVVASIPLSCPQTEANTAVNLDYTFSAVGPLQVSASSPFNLTGISNYVTVSGADIAALTNGSTGGTCGVFVSLGPRDDTPGLALNTPNFTPSFIDLSQSYEASDSSTPSQLSTGQYAECGQTRPVFFALPRLGYLNSTSISPAGPDFAFQASIGQVQGIITGVNPQSGEIRSEYFKCQPADLSSSMGVPTAILLAAPIIP